MEGLCDAIGYHDGMPLPKKTRPPFLIGSQFRDPDFRSTDKFPFNLPWFKEFDLKLDSSVTFFVGENGSGKSTLLEAIATLCGLPFSGGGIQEAANVYGPEKESELAKELSPVFIKRPRDGYFFRAEYYAQFATLLEERAKDPDFWGDPYKSYGGRSLHTQSHGESFLELMQNRLGGGLYLMDEPESALSPQRQLTLLAMIADRVKAGKSQFLRGVDSELVKVIRSLSVLMAVATRKQMRCPVLSGHDS